MIIRRIVTTTLRPPLDTFRRSSIHFAVSAGLVGALACSSSGGPVGGGASGSGGATAGASAVGGSGSGSGGHPSVAGSGGAGTSGAPTSSGGVSAGGIGSDGGSNTGGGSAGVSGGLAGGAAGGATGGASGGGSADPVNAQTLVKAMGFGTNIGNTLENTVTWETGWSQPLITQQYINGLASRGIKTVRVPVAWDTYAVNGVIDAAKMDRVKQVVSFITGAGMYAIVNIHWDGGWIDNEKGTPAFTLTEAIKTKFANYWKQIATAFSGVGHQLILEGMNEEGCWVTDGNRYGPNTDIPALNTMNQLFVTTARAQGGYNATRALLIAGFNTDLEKTCVPAFTVPTDPAGTGKLLLSIHYYTPWTFTIKETNETADSQPITTTWGTAAETKQLEDLFTKLGTCSTDKKIPVVLGEFGVTAGTAPYVREAASRIAWMTAVVKASKARNIVPVLWDTGLEISRVDGAFSSAFQKAFDSFK